MNRCDYASIKNHPSMFIQVCLSMTSLLGIFASRTLSMNNLYLHKHVFCFSFTLTPIISSISQPITVQDIQLALIMTSSSNITDAEVQIATSEICVIASSDSEESLPSTVRFSPIGNLTEWYSPAEAWTEFLKTNKDPDESFVPLLTGLHNLVLDVEGTVASGFKEGGKPWILDGLFNNWLGTLNESSVGNSSGTELFTNILKVVVFDRVLWAHSNQKNLFCRSFSSYFRSQMEPNVVLSKKQTDVLDRFYSVVDDWKKIMQNATVLLSGQAEKITNAREDPSSTTTADIVKAALGKGLHKRKTTTEENLLRCALGLRVLMLASFVV